MRPKKLRGLSLGPSRLLESALTHPSHRNENPGPAFHDFDRLEFFGDSILNFVVCRKLYRAFPAADEGVLSRLRSILVSRKILSRIAFDWNLEKHIKLGRSLAHQGKLLKTKILADTFEAVIAAVYFEKGLERVERFILSHYRGYFDQKRLLRIDPNPKSTLQEISQREWQKLPAYSHQETPKGLKVTVEVDRRRKSSAVAKTRREAEEKAARTLVRRLRQELLLRSKKRSSGKKLRKVF